MKQEFYPHKKRNALHRLLETERLKKPGIVLFTRRSPDIFCRGVGGFSHKKNPQATFVSWRLRIKSPVEKRRGSHSDSELSLAALAKFGQPAVRSGGSEWNWHRPIEAVVLFATAKIRRSPEGA